MERLKVELRDVEMVLRARDDRTSADTSKSAASIFAVDAASSHRWIPQSLLNGKINWEFLSLILETLYGNPRHGNPENPLDCLIFVMLTRKTPIAVGKRIFHRLKKRYPAWDNLLHDRHENLIMLLYGSGLEDIRAGDIRRVLANIKEKIGSLTLEPLKLWSNAKCLKFLNGLPGVGTKTARCVMMYTLGREVFPADAHCIRVLSRFGVIEHGLEHREAQEKLVEIIPKKYAYKLHVNLVAHGQIICTSSNPRCSVCSIRNFCRSYRANVLRSAETLTNAPAVIDLFSGAGGTSYGFIRAGYRILAAVDQDRWACETFILNHPEVSPERVLCRDIKELKPTELEHFTYKKQVDLIVGGPPCQGFSMIGKRVRGLNGKKRFIDDPRNELYKEFVRFVKYFRPRVVVMENVPGLFSLNNGYYREQIRQDLNHDHEVIALVVNAHDFGLPQHRRRALFVGISRKAFGRKASAIAERMKNVLEGFSYPDKTLKAAIVDLPLLKQNDGAEVMKRAFSPGKFSVYAINMGAKDEALIFNHVSRPLNVRDQLLYGRLRPGETGHDAIEKHKARHLMVYRDDIFHDKYRRLVYERPSPTIVAHLGRDGHMFIHPDRKQTRSITVREAARIQSFPDDFIFYAPRTHQFQHVGNAVPPLMAKVIGNIIRKVVREAGYSW